MISPPFYLRIILERVSNENYQLYTTSLITKKYVIPAKAGIQKGYWIPGQARNDKLYNTYVVIYRTFNWK